MTGGLTYPGGAEALIAHWNKRRGAMALGPGEQLEPAADLGVLARTPAGSVADLPETASRHAEKAAEVRGNLQGCSELAVLNGLVISHLRKRRFPAAAPALFQRIWVEQGVALTAELPLRWLISSAITFGDYGATEPQRRLGLQLNMLFSLMKLYEFERLFSGRPPEARHPLKAKVNADLPMGMPPFSLATGGLDINLLAPIWQDALTVPVLGPLAVTLLDRLNGDPGTLFRRLSGMRSERQEKRAKAKKSKET